MVKVKGYVLSENDRAAVRRVVAKVGDTPLFGTALKSRHRPEADADYSYSGYFKIVDASTTGTERPRIKSGSLTARDEVRASATSMDRYLRCRTGRVKQSRLRCMSICDSRSRSMMRRG